MILRTDHIEQNVDRGRRVRLVKDVVMTSVPQLGMVRKRAEGATATRGAVLLVHGFAQNHYTWHSQQRSFSAHLAAEGWDVFALDLRGHGRSRRFSEDRARTADEHVREDIPTAARSALRLSGHDRLFLVGHSMGGLISYAASATLLRDVVRGIVTIGSPYDFGAGTPFRRFGASLLQVLRATGAFDSNPGVPLVWFGDYLRSQRRLWDSRFFPTPIRPWRPGSIEDDVLEDYLGHAFDWTSVQVLFDLFSGGVRTSLHSADGRIDYGAAFEALDKPLLVIAGTEDDLAPPASVRAAVDRSRSRDKTYRVFPLGHVDLVIGREAPSTVWVAVSDWLRGR